MHRHLRSFRRFCRSAAFGEPSSHSVRATAVTPRANMAFSAVGFAPTITTTNLVLPLSFVTLGRGVGGGLGAPLSSQGRGVGGNQGKRATRPASCPKSCKSAARSDATDGSHETCSSRAASDPRIRELRLEDIPPAAGLLCDAFAPPDGYNPLQRRIIVAETEAGLAARLGKSLVLVAEQDDGEIVGSVEAFTPAFLEGKAVRFWNASLPASSHAIAAIPLHPLATRVRARRGEGYRPQHPAVGLARLRRRAAMCTSISWPGNPTWWGSPMAALSRLR